MLPTIFLIVFTLLSCVLFQFMMMPSSGKDLMLFKATAGLLTFLSESIALIFLGVVLSDYGLIVAGYVFGSLGTLCLSLCVGLMAWLTFPVETKV